MGSGSSAALDSELLRVNRRRARGRERAAMFREATDPEKFLPVVEIVLRVKPARVSNIVTAIDRQASAAPGPRVEKLRRYIV